MCDRFGWTKDNHGFYPQERNEAHEAFRKAMVESFNERFGTDVNDRGAWDAICDLLSIQPLPNSVNKMKQVCCVPPR